MQSDDEFQALMQRARMAGAAALPGAGATGQSPEEFNSLLSDAQQRGDMAFRSAVSQSMAVKPDQYAQQRQLAQRLGVAPAVVEAMPEEMSQRDRLRQIENGVAKSPVLRLKFTDADFAKLTQDDVPSLANLEKSIGNATRYMMGMGEGGGAPGALKRGVYDNSIIGTAGVFRMASDLAAIPFDVLEKAPSIGGNPLRRLAEGFGLIAANQTALRDAATPTASGNFSAGVESGFNSAGQNLKYAPLAFLGPAGIAAALTGMVAEQGGMTYQKDRQEGVPQGTATVHAAADMLAEYVGERYFGDVGFLKRLAAGSPLSKLLWWQVSREVPGELGTTLWQNFNDWTLTNPEKSVSEFIREQGDAAVQTAVATLVGGGTQAVIANSVSKGIEGVLGRQFAAREDARLALAFDDMLKASGQTALRERSPEQFRAFVQQVVDSNETSTKSIYVDGEVLAQMPEEVLAQLPAAVREQIVEAAQMHSAVEIPMADVLTVAPGTLLEKALNDHARMTPTSDSRADIEAAGKMGDVLRQDAERVMAQAQDQEAARVEYETVRSMYAKQIADTNRVSPAVAEAQSHFIASFFTAYGSRAGMTASQMQQRYPLRIVDRATEPGQELMSQPRLGEMSVEGYHFSNAERPTIVTGAFGTGLQGSSKQEYLNAADKRLAKRSYFYVDKGTGINPESGVGGIAHRANLSNIYDGDTDPKRLKTGRDKFAFESAVLDAGFSGYLERLDGTQSGQVVMLGDQAISAEVLGPTTKTNGKVVPPKTERPSRGRDQVGDRLRANKNLPMGELTRQRWAEILSKQMPVEYDALQAAGVFDGEGALYKDGLLREFEKNTPAEVYEQGARVRDMTPAVRKLLKSLTPEEQAKVTDLVAAKILDVMKDLPSSKEMAATAYAGRAKRGWYKNSADAISVVFGADAPRFAALLAAMSPQTSVENNLYNALATWKNWTAAGRPVDKAAIVQVMGRSVMGNKLTDSVLPAWVNNSVRALTDADPSKTVLSGPKVNSFFRNLVGVVDEVTNDAWMANYALVDQKIFAGGLNVTGTDPGKGKGYLAMSARVREAAATLTKLTGETWTPAEVQETIWSWAKTLYETAEAAGETRSARQIVEERALSDEAINATPDFSSLFSNPTYAKILEDAGYGPQLESLTGRTDAPVGEQSADGKARPFTESDQLRLELQAARRLERLAENRGDASAAAREQNVEQALARLNETYEQSSATGPATLADFTREGLPNLLSKDGWAVLTAEDPNATKATPEANAAAMKALEADLAALGVEWREVIGKYGETQKSLIIAGITEQQAFDLGAKYGQESILTREGLVYMRDGSVTPATGMEVYDTPPADFYTTIPGTDTYFSVALDWGGEVATDLFPEEFADAKTEVETRTVVDSKGTRAQGGNVNSRGQLVTATKQGLQRFWNWFEGSEATDDKGRPLVLYHSTNNDVTQFETNRETTNSYGILGEMSVRRAGIFLTPDFRFSQEYLREGAGQNVMQVYAALKNPLDLRRGISERVEAELEAAGVNVRYVNNVQNAWELFDSADDGTNDFVDGLRRAGYDGAIFREDSPAGGSEGGTTYVVFEPGQVKSATGNRGTFDANDPSILKQRHASQTPRGTFNPRTLEIVLNPNTNLTTFFHETGHFFPEVLADIASQPNPPPQIAADMATFLKWAGVVDLATWRSMTLEQQRPYHERWAESIEQYVMEGKVPNVELQPLMRRFATWLKSAYGSIKQFLTSRGQTAAGGETLGQSWAGYPSAQEYEAAKEARAGSDRRMAAAWAKQPALKKEAGAVSWAILDTGVRYDPDSFGGFPTQEAYETASKNILRQGGELGPPLALNDDIRRVMDRMLATDEQIRQANEAAGMLPDLDADAAAAERLNKRSMADLKWAVKARDAVIAKLKKQARTIEKDTRAAVTAEVDASPEMQAKAKLDELRKADALDDMALAAVADSFEFETADAMLQAIDAFGPRAEVIDGMTEQRMLEEHGDLIDERAIREAANEAVHNEARARSLATELRTQREMLNPRVDTGETREGTVRVGKKGEQRTETREFKITVNALAEAAKQFAANVISRSAIRDLRNKAWQHTSAERRAAKRWTEATAAGKTEEAVRAKQDQMLNNAAARAALEAKAEMGKTLEFFKRVTKGNDEKVVEKGRDPDIVNAARAVLRAYGIETGTTKAAGEYLAVLKANDPDLYAIVAPMVEAATQNAQPLEALTVAELQDLHEDIKAMWHLAKRSRQMEVDGDLLDRQDLADELFTRMEAIGIPDRVPGEGRAVTKAEERALFLRQGISFLRRVEQWSEGMDGKYGGPFLKYIFQPIKDAADRYRSDRIVYRKKLQSLVDNVAPIVGDQLIKAPELGNAPDGRSVEFGTPGSTRGTAMNEILHAILHTGNESNKRKLLLGRQWATENPDGTVDTSKWDAFIARLVAEGKLTSAHYDFVQGVWDLLEETKPLAQKAHRDAFGRYFAEVTADSFVDPFGVTRRGGYAPAIVDPDQVKDNELRKLAEAENENMAFAFPAPNKGFTKGRVEYNRPLLLDLRTLGQHLDKVLLFSHMTVPARDARKLITDKKVGQPLARIDPSVASGMLQPWLQRSAQQIVETPVLGAGKWARVPSIIRSRAGAALMFANASNTIQQVTGLVLANVKVRRSFIMRAVAQHVAHPVEATRAVWAASPYMDTRANNEVAVLNEQMNDILLNPSIYEKAQAWSMRNAYFLQSAVDNALSPIIWTGAYNQSMAEGMAHDDAVRFADGAVRQTQGTTLPEDVSRLETGPAYARAFTQFIGYFNMVANTNATALKQIAGEAGLKRGAGRAFSVVMMGLLVPIWAAEAIAMAFKGGPDDKDKDGYLDDWLAAVFGFGTVKGMLAMLPIAGQAVNAAVSSLDNNPMNDRISLSPGLSLIESALGGNVQTVKEILSDQKEVNARRAVRDLATLVSVFTGLPFYAAARPLGYAAGVAQGKIAPTGPADAARGLITGTASPESKNK